MKKIVPCVSYTNNAVPPYVAAAEDMIFIEDHDYDCVPNSGTIPTSIEAVFKPPSSIPPTTASTATTTNITTTNSNSSNNNTNTAPTTTTTLKKGQDKKYDYNVPVEPIDDRATGVRLGSFARPHMRAFWYANIANRATIFMWFSVVPVYVEMQKSLGISKEGLWTSTMLSIVGALISRIIVGPLCDIYGGRICLAFIMILTSIPTALQAIVTTERGLFITRFLVGFGGGGYVATTFWMNSMFSKETSGRVHGFTTGFGLAMSLLQSFIGFVVYPIVLKMFFTPELAWRFCMILISFGCLVIAVSLVYLTDDTPKGNYCKLKQSGIISKKQSHYDNLISVISDTNIWILCVQKACNIGIELVVNNALNLYYHEEYGLDLSTAALVAAGFPLSNQFARTLGGRFSDVVHNRGGLRGRLRYQFLYLFVSGLCFILFSYSQTLAASATFMVLSAWTIFFSQASTCGIIPQFCDYTNGMADGLVGASGTAGGIALGFLFRQYEYRDAFCLAGVLIIMSSLLTLFVHVPQQGYLMFNSRNISSLSVNNNNRQLTHSSSEGTDTQEDEDNESLSDTSSEEADLEQDELNDICSTRVTRSHRRL